MRHLILGTLQPPLLPCTQHHHCKISALLAHQHLPPQVPQWSRIGRLRRTKFPHLGSGGGSMYGGGASPGVQAAVAGRLVCDTYLSSRELLREVEYSLSTLASKLLGQQCSEVAPGDVPGALTVLYAWC